MKNYLNDQDKIGLRKDLYDFIDKEIRNNLCKAILYEPKEISSLQSKYEQLLIVIEYHYKILKVISMNEYAELTRSVRVGGGAIPKVVSYIRNEQSAIEIHFDPNNLNNLNGVFTEDVNITST